MGESLSASDFVKDLRRFLSGSSDAPMRAFFDAFPDAIVVVDDMGRIVFANGQASSLFGYENGELIGSLVEMLVPDDLRERHPVLRSHYIEHDPKPRMMGTDLDLFARRKDGTEFPMKLSLSPLEFGDHVFVIAAARDVTEESRARHGLVDSEQRYRLLVENSTDIVWQLDTDFGMFWVSPSVESVLGWRPDELVGTSVRRLIHPDDAQAMLVRRTAVAAGTQTTRAELRVLAADDSYRWMSIQARRTAGVDGSFSGVIVGLRDVTEEVLTRQALVDSDQRYRLLAGNSTDIVWCLDGDEVMTWVSPSVELVLGWRPEQLVGTDVRDLIHPDEVESTEMWWGELRAGSAMRQYESRRLAADGSYRWMSLQARPMINSDGVSEDVIEGLRDIHDEVLARTELEKLAHELADSVRQYRLLAENASDVVWQVAPDGCLDWVSESVIAVLGWRREQVLGRVATNLVHPNDRPRALIDRQAVLAGGTAQGEYRILRADGSFHAMALNTHPGKTEGGIFEVVSLRDIQAEVNTRSRLAHAIEHDPLTGLTTLPVAIARIDRLLGELAGRAQGRLVGVLCVGIDSLKAVNDALSHAAGDRVLTTIAARIGSVAESPDSLARSAGDEFLVLLSDLVSGADAAVIAEQVRIAAKGSITIQGHRLEPTVSIGVATGGPDAKADKLVRDGTLAMRRAKVNGRDRCEFAEAGLAEEAQRRLSIDADIRHGLRDGQFVPWFQPIVSLDGGALVGYEALVRWVRPNGSIVAPDDFLPIAERTSLITEIDLAVLRQTVDVLASLPEHLHIAANLSATTLADPNYADWVIECLTASGVDSTRLHLEFTETALLNVTDRVRDVMGELAEIGIGWYIDDFGTGYSSIAHLRDLPIAGLKLDLSFTRGLGGNDPTSEDLLTFSWVIRVPVAMDRVLLG